MTTQEELCKQALDDIKSLLDENPYQDTAEEKLLQIGAVIIQLNIELRQLQQEK